MDELKIKRLWEEICFILHKNISKSISEEMYEQKIVMCLEKMGWSQFKREIILKQVIPVGSAQSIVSDIIVKSHENNISFVIEVKKPSISVDGDNFKNQLFSYMRQLRLEFGILIGKEIQIFYDSNLSSPILLKTIEFTDDDVDFVELFQKESFSSEKLNYYAQSRIKIINAKNKIDELKELLLSGKYNDKLKELIQRDIIEDFDEKTVANVLEKLNVSITYEHEIVEPKADSSFHDKHGKVEYVFYPPDKQEFEKQLLKKKFAHIKIIYSDGHEDYKPWKINKFTEDSSLMGNISSKTWFRKDYIKRHGVIKAIFSINPFKS
jgi:hypothetical protein